MQTTRENDVIVHIDLNVECFSQGASKSGLQLTATTNNTKFVDVSISILHNTSADSSNDRWIR